MRASSPAPAAGTRSGAKHVDGLARQPERLPTGGQHGQPRAVPAQPLDQGNDGVEDVLAVVEHQQHRPVLDELLDRPRQREVLALLDVERAGDERDGGVRVAHGGQLDDGHLRELFGAGGRRRSSPDGSCRRLPARRS